MKTPAPLLEELEEQLCAELEDLCSGGHDPEDPPDPEEDPPPGLEELCRTLAEGQAQLLQEMDRLRTETGRVGVLCRRLDRQREEELLRSARSRSAWRMRAAGAGSMLASFFFAGSWLLSTLLERWVRGWEGALLACVLCVALGLLLLYLEKSGLHPVRGCLTWLLIDEGE